MELNIEIKGYKLNSIINITKEPNIRPISEGLAIEKDGCVIMFIKWSERDDYCIIEPVAQRILMISRDEWNAVKELIKVAIDLIILEHNNEEDLYD